MTLKTTTRLNLLYGCRLELCNFFYKLYVALLHMLETFYLSIFFKYFIKTEPTK